MKKFDLSIYKDCKQYFIMFYVLIKGVNSNKESFLESILISPSSYRRAKNDGNKIGKQITKELCEYFRLKPFKDSIIDELEKKINAIYFNVYYKIFDTYNDDLKWIEDMISQNYIFFPILKLLKLIMLLNGVKSPNTIINENQELFNEVMSYENFYTGMLLELLEIVEVSFKQDVDDYFLARRYKNELTYYTISTKCMLLNKYIESIHFCQIAKHSFIKEENYKRVYYANLTLLSNYNSLFKFEEAYELANRQLLSLESIKANEFEYLATKRHYIVSCVGLKKYQEVVDKLINESDFNTTEICSLLISSYHLNNAEYKKYYSKLINEEDDPKNIELFNLLNRYLKNKEKKILLQLEQYKFSKTLKEILKKM